MPSRINSIGEINYPFRPDGGVNVLNHQTAIADNQMTRCANMFPDSSGILMNRPGISNIALIDYQIAGGAYDVEYYSLNLALPVVNLGYTYLHHHFMTGGSAQNDLDERVQLFNADTAHYDTRPTITLGTGFATDPLSIVNYKGNTLVIGPRNLIEGFQYWQAKPSGGVIPNAATFVHDPTTQSGVPTAQTQVIPVKPTVGCTYQGRMVYGNFGPGRTNWLVFADANTPAHTNTDVAPVFTVVGPDVLAFNGRHIELDAAGENIVLMRETMLQSVGAPVQTALMVITAEGSCFIGTGIIPETFEDPSAIGTLEFQKVNYKCGCVAAATFVKTQFGYIWADTNEVWCLINNTPLKLGSLIGNELSNYPPDTRKWWSAAYIDYKYVLQCVISRGSDDRFLQRVQWWLDLTNGIPKHTTQAEWFGPHQVLRDLGDEGTILAPGKGAFLSGIATDYDGNRVIGLCNDSGYPGGTGLSLIDYTTNFGSDDNPFQTTTGGLEWTPSTLYSPGDIARPTFYVNVGHIFVCTTGGTSGTTEPTGWNFDGSGHVTDGSVIWTELSFATQFRLLTTNYKVESYKNGMDILTKDFILGEPELDKVLKAVTLYAYSSITQKFTMGLRRNQGAVSNALNGTHNISAIFGQDANTLQSGTSQLDITSIAQGQLEGKSLRPAEGTIHKFKSLQFHIYEGMPDPSNVGTVINSGYVVDGSNNSIVFGFYDGLDSIYQLFQADLALDNTGTFSYANIEALYAAIVAAMNARMAGITTLITDATAPFIISNNPFTYRPPGDGQGVPYFNTIKLLASSKGAHCGWGLFYGNSNAFFVNDFDGHSGTYDFAKSKGLMALIGMDTEQTVNAGSTFDGNILPNGTYFSPINFAAEGFTSGQLPVYSKEIMPYTRSANTFLMEAVIRARATATAPLSFSNR